MSDAPMSFESAPPLNRPTHKPSLRPHLRNGRMDEPITNEVMEVAADIEGDIPSRVTGANRVFIRAVIARAIMAAKAEEREACAKLAEADAFAIEANEQDCRSWGGPDPRGPHVSVQNLNLARNLRNIAKSIRARSPALSNSKRTDG